MEMTAKGSDSCFNTGKNMNDITVSELLQTVALHPNIFFENISFQVSLSNNRNFIICFVNVKCNADLD